MNMTWIVHGLAGRIPCLPRKVLTQDYTY